LIVDKLCHLKPNGHVQTTLILLWLVGAWNARGSAAVDSLSRPQSRTGVKAAISAATEVAQRTREQIREASALQRANTLPLTIRGLLSLE
jgi:hypothetical protein